MMWYEASARRLGRLGMVAGFCLAVGWSVPGVADDEEAGAGEKEGGKKEASGKEGEGDEAKKVAKGGSAFGAFLPVGLTNEGVTIPSFEGGVRTSLIKAKTMTRVDEDHLQMDDMVIENFLPDGTVDSKIVLLRARYHMPSGVLTSRSRSRIERPDFEVEGDGLVFDTESQRGRMEGNVEMLIFDVKEFGVEPGGEEAAESGGEGGGDVTKPEESVKPGVEAGAKSEGGE